MLNHRTNVLLDENDYQNLMAISKSQNQTMGELIRKAIRQTYASKNKTHQAETISKIKHGWQLLRGPGKRLDYHSLIEDGRKK